MANIAILVGNTDYRTLATLACCADDVRAVEELMVATGKFDSVEVILNQESSQLKERIRISVDAHRSIGEIFFYFTGHGYQHDSEFFFCATNFDPKRPHETGVSNSELHTLLRTADADLVVKVIDACSSGSLLVKSSDGAFLPTNKQGFKHLIQIASCLDSQSALTGDPLSLFTDKFRKAALRKSDGIVYYTDIIDALRDDFLDNDNQTPHFVSQGTGREQFVEDAKRLDVLRSKLSAVTRVRSSITSTPEIIPPPLSPLDILRRAENKFANRDVAQVFISRLFDRLSEEVSSASSFGEFFTAEIVVHPDFREPTTRAFIIRVLSKETRPDNFVTAAISREQRKRDPFNIASLASIFQESDHTVEHYDLELNCELQKAQMKITLTPKFVALKRFVLVVTCAPSLEVCYVMEMLTRHALKDWNVFDSEGIEVVRRWYKRNWSDSPESLVEKMCSKLRQVVQESVDAAAKALSEQDSPK